jgi:hypothetical protein
MRDEIFAHKHGGKELKPPAVPQEDPAITEARALVHRCEAEYFAASAMLSRCPEFLHEERLSLGEDVRRVKQKFFEAEEDLRFLQSSPTPLKRAEHAVILADRVRQRANAALRAWRPSDGPQSREELQKLRVAVRDAQDAFNRACERMCQLKNERK